VERSADEIGALCETVVFLGYFKELPDTRQIGKVKYPLGEILLLCLLAVVAGAETITDIARFGRLKLALLRRFRRFEDGTPAHDHLGDILATLDTEAFERCFVAWVAAQTGVPAGVIAVDGKTVRRSGSKTSKKKKDLEGPIHIVSAFAARQRMVLGQVKVGEKSNEIVAIPKLLGMLAIEGAVVTIDAMGCQRDIAQTIIDKNADYILALKGNQGTLKDDAKLFVDEQRAVDCKRYEDALAQRRSAGSYVPGANRVGIQNCRKASTTVGMPRHAFWAKGGLARPCRSTSRTGRPAVSTQWDRIGSSSLCSIAFGLINRDHVSSRSFTTA
jgi:predicted transposase YbfD/YdcC